MTNQQDLRERIIEICVNWDISAEQMADQILALLSPPDPGLASLVGEIDALFEKATRTPWALRPHEHDDWGMIRPVEPDQEGYRFPVARALDGKYTTEKEKNQHRRDGTDPYAPNAALIVALVNNWPAIRAALTTDKWRSIDSAPKDGTKVLCWTPEQSVCLYWCKHRGGWFEWADNEFCMFPTHWMPLPEPPTSKPDTGGWRDGRKSTGMRDEEGREIFEGDWVQFNVSFFDGNFKDEPISGKIVYVPELMSFQLVNVQSDYWREYTGGDDSTYQPFSELNFSEADFRVIEPPLPNPPSKPDTGE